MNRDELVEAAAQALAEDRYAGLDVKANSWHRRIAAVIVDTVLPLIEADR